MTEDAVKDEEREAVLRHNRWRVEGRTHRNRATPAVVNPSGLATLLGVAADGRGVTPWVGSRHGGVGLAFCPRLRLGITQALVGSSPAARP